MQPSEPTTADIVVPYIADVIAAYTLSGYFGIDTSSSTALMMSIKNSMSVMATVVAVDSMSRIVMDVVPDELKDSAFNYIDRIYGYSVDTAQQMTSMIHDYFWHQSEQ